MNKEETFDELFADYVKFCIETKKDARLETILEKSVANAEYAENSFFNFEGTDNVLAYMAKQTMAILEAASKLDLGKMSFEELKAAFKREVEKEKSRAKKS